MREHAELAAGGGLIEGALDIPLSRLRSHLSEVPRDRDVWILCAAGQRAYVAQRMVL